jgi:hypothetical protein
MGGMIMSNRPKTKREWDKANSDMNRIARTIPNTIVDTIMMSMLHSGVRLVDKPAYVEGVVIGTIIPIIKELIEYAIDTKFYRENDIVFYD